MGVDPEGPRPFFRALSIPGTECERRSCGNKAQPIVTRKREMEGNPTEFRRRALTCARLALVSPIPDTRRAYAKLAASWLRLASELENGPRRCRFKRHSNWNPLPGRVVQPGCRQASFQNTIGAVIASAPAPIAAPGGPATKKPPTPPAAAPVTASERVCSRQIPRPELS
jgi:hypothetical protein